MVSDFVDEVDGYLRVDGEEARVHILSTSQKDTGTMNIIMIYSKLKNVYTYLKRNTRYDSFIHFR